MRFSNMFGASEDEKNDDVAGVTIDVMTGIVAGVALVLALLILASSLKPAQAAPAREAPAKIVSTLVKA